MGLNEQLYVNERSCKRSSDVQPKLLNRSAATINRVIMSMVTAITICTLIYRDKHVLYYIIY